ncbi:CBS domain-containing protein [Teredinibacter purpureus]|jgi:Predicted transcriptional regulator, contains C-terminal CBS domains|uniref:CBS domain-containing protein n=1 Tax=Teredinibacter purpureus TaxID=2731756 RepID=UPI0006961D22|nr:CBS domain-containing protein [Teredinibacter purpureus]
MGVELMTQPHIADALNERTLSDLMSRNILTVYEGWSVKRVAAFFVKHGISGAPVIAADDELVGVVTQTDVVRFGSRSLNTKEVERLTQFYCGPYGGELSEDDVRHMQERASENCTVHSIMTPEVIGLDISTPLADVCQVLVERQLHRLFVTESERLVGVITARDILQKLLEA